MPHECLEKSTKQDFNCALIKQVAPESVCVCVCVCE
jgi:hypothetical protein